MDVYAVEFDVTAPGLRIALYDSVRVFEEGNTQGQITERVIP